MPFFLGWEKGKRRRGENGWRLEKVRMKETGIGSKSGVMKSLRKSERGGKCR